MTAALLFLTMTVFSLDPGGVSVDLNLLKGASAAGKEVKNLLRSGDFEGKDIFHKKGSPWYGGSYVWSKSLKGPEHKKKIFAGQRRYIDPKGGVNGSACAVIYSPDTLAALQDSDGNPWMSNSFNQIVGIEDSAEPVKYTLIFKVKGKTGKSAGINSFRTFIHFYNKKPGIWKGLKKNRASINHAVSVSRDYEVRSLSFVAPAHTPRLDINLTLYGQGQIFIDDVQLIKNEIKAGAVAYVTPWTFLDNTWCIGEKQPGTIVFEMQNEKRVKYKKLLMTVKIPAGFKLHSGNEKNTLVSLKKNPDNSSTAVFNIQSFVAGMPKDGYGMWSCPSVTLIPEISKSETLYPLEYQLSEGNWKSDVKTLNLKVIAPLQGKRPKNYVSGVQVVHEFNLPSDKLPVIRDFLNRTGLNALHGGNNNLKKSVKTVGMARYVQPHLLCNGYRLGGARNRTPESYFRQIDGTPFKRGNFKTCPVEVYKRGTFYRNEVLGMLEDMLVKNDLADQIMPNWEPYYLDFKGCFCDRCREEFVIYMKGKAKPEDIRAKWPRMIIDTYRESWIKFRSWQHGRLIVTLEKDINALGKKAGKDSHFMPEIAWSQLVESDKKGYGQYSPLDYMAELPWLEPWGPYIFSSFTEKYTYYPGIHLITFTAADDNKKFLKRYIKNPAKRPKLIALPHGFQCGTWVTEPEAFAFETLCFFLQGWEGSFGYYFPRGYDHRYWNALARANTIIAEHENIVMKGQLSKAASVTVLTPVPKPFFPAFWSEGGNFKKRLPGLASAKIVQLKAYRNGKNTVAALGNFWQKGEVFAKLSVKDLDKKGTYTVNSSDNYSLGTFTGAQLAKGITVHAGALRWNLLTILPGKQIKGEVIPQSALNGMMKKRIPAILKAMEWEKRYAKKMLDEESADNPVNDFKAVYELNNAKVNLKAVNVKGKDYLQITATDYVALLDPGAGARIASLKVKGKELVHSLGFGADGFWAPLKVSFNVVKGYKITGMEKSTRGIKVELTRTLGPREKSTLAGLRIIKTFFFNPGNISVKSSLTNNNVANIEFAFRFHNIPRHLADIQGKAYFGNVSFEREQALKIVRFGKADEQIDKAYKVKRFLNASVKTFTLKNSGLPDLYISMGGSVPYGVIFWDAGTFSTVEPVFNRIDLAPGKTAGFELDFKW